MNTLCNIFRKKNVTFTLVVMTPFNLLVIKTYLFLSNKYGFITNVTLVIIEIYIYILFFFDYIL